MANTEYRVTMDELAQTLKTALHDVYDYRYRHVDEDEDWYRAYGMALDAVLNEMGVEHEQWNPIGFLKYEEA